MVRKKRGNAGGGNGHGGDGEPAEEEFFEKRAAKKPAISLAHNGPVARYLAASGKSREEFDTAFRAGGHNAVALFAQDVVFQEVLELKYQIENLRNEIDACIPIDI